MKSIVFSPYLSNQESNNTDYMVQPEQKSYACECQLCGLTHYTSYKRLNCEFCGCDSNQFTCRELE